MDISTIFLTIIAAAVGNLLLHILLAKWRNYPPGPLPIPLLGNLLQLLMIDANKPYCAMQVLAKKYGNVMSLQMGPARTVVISGFDMVKEVLNSEDFNARFAPPWFLKRSFDKSIGILFGDVPTWRETRKFTVKNLRDFGFGKKQSMESLIIEEAQGFIEDLEKQLKESPSIPVKGMFNLRLINSIFAMLCGFRFEPEDQNLKHLLHLLREYFSSIKNGGDVLMAYPLLAKISPVYYKQLRIHKEMHTFFRKIISDARNREGRAEDPCSFVDVFVNAIESSGPDETFNDENLLTVIYDFFMAGGETTSSVLEFLVLYLILNPEIQRKVIDEVDSVLGKDRFPTYEDRIKMQYTEAVILETLRIAAPLPIAPRKSLRATTLNGYTIEEDILVSVNLYDVHMDETYWGDPLQFRPERFLNEQGVIFNTEHLIPYSLGKRSCLGDTMAKMSLFLFTTRLFQVFTVHVDPSSKLPTTEPSVGITMGVQPFQAVLKRR